MNGLGDGDGKKLMLVTFATILILPASNGPFPPEELTIHLAMFRILLGARAVGDYHMAATIPHDHANLHKQCNMLAYILSNQG
ncbi:hypothetical protein M407DRAFT_34936 [Tulasnella calospora MUT 4182]|uniref:Uncharacterized protein n=1 Tax=Tulasnella calospora MUT 4182 TaxID=1051891 RepID=A0A0C3K237_9AGAM|nr:hypothetical protein M407DRAFT_34936 [Tulasnella calospora MUT 4182]